MQAAWVAALTVSFMLSGNRMDASAQNAAETVQESNGEKVEDQKPQQPEEEQENTWENHGDSEEISEEIVEETAEENSQEITEEFLEETEIEVVAETETEAEVIAETKTEEVTEEIHDQDTEESEQELILEPEYQPEKDPNPLANNILQYLGEKELEQIRNIELPDPDWVAINGEKATCTSYARLQYGYTPEVQVGTIRYISQIAGSGLFDWNYWGSWGNQAGIECGTASISMAMSYIGVNLTPQQILDAHGGLTCFTGWGVVDLSPDVAGGVEQYVNGQGQYSPVIVHLPTYSQLGHYVVLIGKLSDSEYLVLDCAQKSTWVMTAGDSFYNSIDQVYQYYNPDAPVLDHTVVTDKPVMSTCVSLGLTAGSHCEVCGEVLTEQQVVPCNGHVWSDWVTRTEPTTQQQGEKVRFCQVCGTMDVRSIDCLPEEMVLEMPQIIWE